MNRRVIVRVIVWVASLVVVVAAGFGAWRYRELHQPPPVTYQTTPLARRHIVGRVTATGTLLATVTVTVGTQVSGRIAKLLADYNSPVKKGQLIAKIDPLLFQAAVEQARANFESSEANLKAAKAQADLAVKQLAREQALLKDNLAAQQDVDNAQSQMAVTAAQVDVAAAAVAQNQAQLHQAQTNLSYTDIISPIDGTVISRSVDTGQTVAASLQAPVLFTIAEDLTKMQVNTNVSEGDVGRLEEGMPAYFTVDAYPGERFKGKISQIRNSATTVSNVVTYDAVIDVNNTDLRLRPGMTANATITYADKKDVLAVPNAALRFKPPPEANIPKPEGSAATAHRPRDGAGGAGGAGGEGRGGGKGANDPKVIWTLNDSAPVQVSIKTGLSDGAYTEIVTGSDPVDPANAADPPAPAPATSAAAPSSSPSPVKEGDIIIVDATVAGKDTTTAAPTTTARRSPF
ncbi:MAG TPA: efflux RND transporter periplasmic adaptor subunit [Polyangiaceae bacterium]|jgi:HlyD family secretion protein|nr:efflux RND transporter periplasmic adaptor subunit [Polyangiaceae bacterium]